MSTTTIEPWERAARLDDLKGEGPFAVSANGVPLVALRSKDGAFKVYEGLCPHQGALLGEGELEEGALVCRNHRWRFDRETGQRIGGRGCLRSCAARSADGALYVDVNALQPISADGARARRAVEDLPGPRRLPLLGNTLSLDPDQLHLQLEGWAREFGPLFQMNIGGRPVVIVSDPELAEPIFRERPETYRRVSNVEVVFRELSVAGVFSAEGEAWRAQRRLAMEALANKNLRGFYPTLAVVAGRLAKRWNRAADEGRVLDMAAELKRFTVDVTTQLVFGYDMNTLEKDDDEDIIQRDLEPIFPALNRRLNALIPYWRYVRLPEDRRLDRALVALREWVAEMLEVARERMHAEPGAPPRNFLEAMLVARDADGRPFSEEVIHGNSLTMLLAGEDTTAYTLAWCIHHLIDDRAATAELRAEVDSLLPERRWPKDVDEAGRLAYATAVANEAMRLRPVAPTIFHEPNRDVVIRDVLVPKGTMIITLTRPPVLEASRFRDPEQFNPSRWLPGWEGAHEPSAAIPFGSGPRICPGRSLAILEMRVVLSLLYRSFEVERVGDSRDVKEITAFTMMPKGLSVLLRRRS